MFKIGIGHTEDPDSQDAADDVISQCKAMLGEAKPQVCIVFCAIDYDYPVVLKRIHEAFPDIQIVGCSAGGELSSRMGYTEGTLMLITFASNTISMATTVAREISRDISGSVKQALSEAREKLKGEPVFCLIFPDIFTSGTVALVDEMKKQLGQDFPILGGGASDPWKFNQTCEFYNEEIMHDSAPMLFFAGPISYVFSVVSGWEPFTNKKVVMDCNKNIVYKIGEDTALDYYKHYLGGSPTIAHPLAVFESGQKRFYLRAPLDVDEKSGSVTLGGDLPKEAMTSICQAEPNKLISETHHLIQETMDQIKNEKPVCAMIISCSCRQKILGTKTQEEYQVLREALAQDIPIFGFYAYGQVSPFEKGKSSFVHNESVVALMLKETETV